jgi:hypothetical protein
MHQKHPPAKIAVSVLAVAVVGSAAMAALPMISMEKMMRIRFIGRVYSMLSEATEKNLQRDHY